jgi:excisionase family DNA binding protein
MKSTIVDKRLLTTREAATRLGISTRLLWTLTKDGSIPAVQIRRKVLYDDRDLERFIDQCKTSNRQAGEN